MPTARELINLVRHAGPILAALRRARLYDQTMSDTANDGRNARAPDGDDFNEVFAEVMHCLRLIEQGK
jgi:hypothetical protein